MEAHSIDLDRTDDAVIVVLRGEHDVYTAPSLREQIAAAIAGGGPLVVDLTPATFIDSSVLRVLLEARRQAQEQGLGFAIALGDGEAPGVRRILEVTGLISVFPVLPARDAAMQAAKEGQLGS